VLPQLTAALTTARLRESGFSDIRSGGASMRAAFYEGHETISLGHVFRSPPLPAGDPRLSRGICGTDLHIFHGKMDTRVKMP
jgi:hypothetical protein